MLNTDATLNAESGEECGEYAHDELEHRLESFFVFCVFHGILIIKLMMGLRDAFEMCSGHKPFCFTLQRYYIRRCQSYGSVRCRTNFEF